MRVSHCLVSYFSISLLPSTVRYNRQGIEKHIGVSFVLIRFVIGELLSEVSSGFGHGLVLAWFESSVLRLVSLGQDKHFGILLSLSAS